MKYNYKVAIRLLTVGILITAIIAASGCTNKQAVKQPAQKQEERGILTGVGLSPNSFEEEDFKEFFDKAEQMGQIVMWAGDWGELQNTEGGTPMIIAELSKTIDYNPLIEVQFFNQDSGKLLRPLTEATKKAYKESIASFVEKYKLEYLGIGIEINLLYEKSESDFMNFVEFYDEVYDAIKAKSPSTKVFTVFQLEKMKGLHGGLFGGKNAPEKSQWALLDYFSNSDLAVFTTYPGLIYKSPSEIPKDYYMEIARHTSKPIAFTEVGWHSDKSIEEWGSDEAKQAEFIRTFFEYSEGLNRELVIWSFLYDQDTMKPFDSMGLWEKDGKSKLAWDEWLKAIK